MGGGGPCDQGTDAIGDGCPAVWALLLEPYGIAVDGIGNLYIGEHGRNLVRKVDVSDAPSLAFGSILVGGTAAWLDNVLTLLNLGNAPLNVSQVSSTAAEFSLGALAGSCSSSSQSLEPAASCLLDIEFHPTVPGNVSGSFVLVDDNLNVSNAKQTIAEKGTGIALAATTTTLTAAPTPASIGSYVALTASVSSTTAGNIVGTVTFSVGGATLGTAQASGGTATLYAMVSAANGFSVGTDSITASFVGSAGYIFANSNGSMTLTVTVTKSTYVPPTYTLAARSLTA